MTNRTPPNTRSAIEKPNITIIKLELENIELKNKIKFLEEEKQRIKDFLEMYDCEEFQRNLNKFRKKLFK